MKRTLFIFLLAASVATLAPLARPSPAAFRTDQAFPGWPTRFEGRPLEAAPLTAEDALFARDFPGRIERFSDGRRHILLRWVAAPTRQLHPASQCFRGAGYRVEPAPMRRSEDGVGMACFIAARSGRRYHVCESIEGSDGQHWPDVSAWYWSALVAPAGTSWWSRVVVEERAGRSDAD